MLAASDNSFAALAACTPLPDDKVDESDEEPGEIREKSGDATSPKSTAASLPPGCPPDMHTKQAASPQWKVVNSRSSKNRERRQKKERENAEGLRIAASVPLPKETATAARATHHLSYAMAANAAYGWACPVVPFAHYPPGYAPLAHQRMQPAIYPPNYALALNQRGGYTNIYGSWYPQVPACHGGPLRNAYSSGNQIPGERASITSRTAAINVQPTGSSTTQPSSRRLVRYSFGQPDSTAAGDAHPKGDLPDATLSNPTKPRSTLNPNAPSWPAPGSTILRPASHEGFRSQVESYLIRAVESGTLARSFCVRIMKRLSEASLTLDDWRAASETARGGDGPPRVSLEPVMMWSLSALTSLTSNVMERLLGMNIAAMIYSQDYSYACTGTLGRSACIDVYCSKAHAVVTQRDKLRAFRGAVQILLNEAKERALLDCGAIGVISRRLVRDNLRQDRRIGTLRELATLIMLADFPQYRDVVRAALLQFGTVRLVTANARKPQLRGTEEEKNENADLQEVDDKDEDSDGSEVANLRWEDFDKEKVLRKAIETTTNRSMSVTWDVQRQRCNVGAKKAAVFLGMWNRRHPENTSTVLSVYMLLCLLLEDSDEEIVERLQEAKIAGFERPKAGTKAKLTPAERMAQIRQTVLLRADDLGVIPDLSKTSESDTYRFCSGLPLNLATIFGRLVHVPTSEGETDEHTDEEDDAFPEEDVGVDGLGKDWRELIHVHSVHEARRGRRLWSLVFGYCRHVSNKFAHQDRTSDAALYLVLLLELLHEFRSRAENGTLEFVRTNGAQHVVIGWELADEAVCRQVEEDINPLIHMIESRVDTEWDYVTTLKSVKSKHSASTSAADQLSRMISKVSISAA